MITRYALFEGSIADGQDAAFRQAILDEVLPVWRTFPGVLDVRVCFGEARDEGAPEFPMILAMDFEDMAAVEAALASPARTASRAATMSVLDRYFTGRIHHHVTVAHGTRRAGS
jgi:hypothetical protein